MFRGISGISGIPENEDRQEPEFKSECTTKSGGDDGNTRVVMAQRCLLFDGLYVSEKVSSPHDVNIVLGYFGGTKHDGALRIDWGGQYGGVISISSVLEKGQLYRPRPTRR